MSKALGQATSGYGAIERIAALSGHLQGALLEAAANLPPERTRSELPTGTDLGEDDNWWGTLGIHEYARVLQSSSIRAVQDVLVLTRSRFGYSSSGARRQRYAFRGEHKADPLRALVPRRGREYATRSAAGEDHVATAEEIADLREFQERWANGNVWAPESDISAFSDLSLDDPQWWALMQHYGAPEGKGTRLLDVTGSALAGLFFACVSWKGRVDIDADGVIYIMDLSESRVRPMYEGASGDFVDPPPAHWSEMFNTKHAVPTLYIPKRMHARAQWQKGCYLFWREFYKSFPGQTFYAIVDKDAKLEIAHDLLRHGIRPSLLVGGVDGEEADQCLTSQLGETGEMSGSRLIGFPPLTQWRPA